MAVIAVTDIETRGAAEWAAEDWGATYSEVYRVYFYFMIVKIILMYVMYVNVENSQWAVV